MEYVAPDGLKLSMAPPFFIVQDDGYGMPPIDYVTQRGPFQHGVTPKDFFLLPRVIQVIYRRNACSRAEYWNLRAQLLDVLRPGRLNGKPTPGILRKYLSNGKVREFFAIIQEGPSFPSNGDGTWDEWSIRDTLRFVCHDPVARDPNVKSVIVQSSGGTSGLFPITFPFTFGSLGTGGVTITYGGTWLSYPTIVFTGPLTGPIVNNLTTGEKVQLDTTIPAGRVVTANLQYGFKTVQLDDGTNYIGFVSPDSDMASFHLQPGTNQMQIIASGTSVASSIAIQWFERFIGI